ncbi:MAG: Fur family transcriptional regulator [Clostridiales bacterium]|nr:iron dependent repressor, metal binding and dimerization domain protein [Bacillota bacterium]NLK91206.1 Fur family transcriptional regulator [Clostridiales bacterium]
MMKKDFFTFSEYIKKDQGLLTPSMEDYVEMVYRLSRDTGYTRINELSNALNVQPPSVTRMIQKLAEIHLVNYERYGVITLTEKGKLKGSMLLMRHNIVENFLKSIGIVEGILEETEKIEHIVSRETLKCMAHYLSFLRDNPDIEKKFKIYRESIKTR